MGGLSLEEIRKGLTTRFLGQNVIAFESVGSTNEVAKRLAREGTPEGTLVIAEEQTVGKGRRGRRWLAPRGTSLLFSLVFYPPLAPGQVARLTMAASLATAETIEGVSGLRVGFKWPNDILIRGRKAGGVLTEMGVTGERLDYAVVGVGLNVNWDPSQFPELSGMATSIAVELGHQVSRLELLQRLLVLLEEGYLRLQERYSPHRDWGSRLANLGQEVEVLLPRGSERGVVEGVDPDGALLLRRKGLLKRVTVGEVG